MTPTLLPCIALSTIAAPNGGDAPVPTDLSLLADERPLTFAPDYFAKLHDAKDDALGETVLRQPGDPSWEKVVGLLPPLVDYTFLGDETCDERPLVAPNGTIPGYFESPAPFDPANPHQHWRRSLVDGWLPAIHFAFWDDEARAGFEEVAFGAPGDDGRLEVWVWLRQVAPGADTVSCFRCSPQPHPASEGAFAARLASLRRKWAGVLDAGARVSIPDETALNGVRASLVQGLLTFNGCQPHYGVDGYRADVHSSFPPATIALATCAMEWGLFGRARDILSHYLARFVEPDGTFDYYGPAVSEYGQMLSVCARCFELTGDRDWLSAHVPILQRIVGRILRLRDESKAANPPGSLTHGLIRGLPEADYHDSKEEWERFYYSGDCWCARGLREMGRALIRLAEATGDDAHAAQGRRLVSESDAYAADINRSLRGSLLQTPDGPFVPPGPGFPKPFDRLTESRHASYCNYRYYPEMMSSRILDRDLLDALVGFRRTHGGELLGMTRFEGWLDDWPVWNCARCLMDRDERRRAMLLFYAHLAHHQSRGTFTAYEQVPFDYARTARAGQCVPSQVAAPLMLRWMLCYEAFDEDVLRLCPAVPREWVRGGIQCHGLPTRWGPVSLGIREDRRANAVKAVVDLPPRGIPAEIRIRLPHPDGRPLRSVTVNRRPWDRLDLPSSTVLLDPGRKGRLHIRASYNPKP